MRVHDVCTRKESPRTHYATLTKDDCLQTCQNRDITGCEFWNDAPNRPQCFFHTKYILGASLHHAGEFCWKIKKGMNYLIKAKVYPRIEKSLKYYAQLSKKRLSTFYRYLLWYVYVIDIFHLTKLPASAENNVLKLSLFVRLWRMF